MANLSEASCASGCSYRQAAAAAGGPGGLRGQRPTRFLPGPAGLPGPGKVVVSVASTAERLTSRVDQDSGGRGNCRGRAGTTEAEVQLPRRDHVGARAQRGDDRNPGGAVAPLVGHGGVAELE